MFFGFVVLILYEKTKNIGLLFILVCLFSSRVEEQRRKKRREKFSILIFVMIYPEKKQDNFQFFFFNNYLVVFVSTHRKHVKSSKVLFLLSFFFYLLSFSTQFFLSRSWTIHQGIRKSVLSQEMEIIKAFKRVLRVLLANLLDEATPSIMVGKSRRSSSIVLKVFIAVLQSVGDITRG